MTPASGFGSPPVIAPTTRVRTNAMTTSATKLMMKGAMEGFLFAGSILAAFIQGLLSAMYQTAPNSHATTAATITASQFTTEKSMNPLLNACRVDAQRGWQRHAC